MRITLIVVPVLALFALLATKVTSRPSIATRQPATSVRAAGVAVMTTKVTRGEMEQTLNLTGVLRAETQVNIGTKLPARAHLVRVKEGDRVAPGQLLVQLDDRDYLGQVQQAEAGLRAAQANVAKARQGTPLRTTETNTQIAQAEENVRAAESQRRAAELGEKLEAKQADADIEKAQSGVRSAEAGLAKAKKGARPEEIARAEAGVKQAELGQEKMQREFAGAEKLFKSGGLTRKDFEDAQTGLRIAQEQLNDARAALKLARGGATAEDIALAQEEVQRAKNGLELARSTADDRKRVAHERTEAARTQVMLAHRQLELARAGKAQIALSEEDVRAAQAQVDQARAGLALARQQVEEAKIRTPVAGVVSDLNVHTGEMLLPGAPLMKITSVASVFLEASLPLRDLATVRRGQAVTITVDADSSKVYQGTVAEIIRVATDDNRSFKMRVAVSNQDGKLTHGALARGVIQLARVTAALIVPREALLALDESARTARLYVVEDGRAMERKVTLGLLHEKRAQIIDGAREGDTVIVAGAAMLKSGDPVLNTR